MRNNRWTMSRRVKSVAVVDGDAAVVEWRTSGVLGCLGDEGKEEEGRFGLRLLTACVWFDVLLTLRF